MWTRKTDEELWAAIRLYAFTDRQPPVDLIAEMDARGLATHPINDEDQ